MSIRFTVLASATAAVALAAPARAQEDPAHIESLDVLHGADGYDGDWQGRWEDEQTWRGTWNGTFTTGAGEVALSDGRFAYSFAEREAWLSDCRLLMADAGGYRPYDDYYEYENIDANALWSERYCEAYLRRYEMGSGAGFHGETSVAVALSHGRPGHRHTPRCTITVREEWVEAE